MFSPKNIFENFDIGVFFSYLLGFVGLYLAYKYRQSKRLEFFWWKNNTLIDLPKLDIPGLTVAFNNKPLKGLHRLKVFFKNDGNVHIVKDDLINKLKIKFKTYVKIIDVLIYSTNKYNSKSNLKTHADEVAFDFDFLEKGDYIRVDILYSSDKLSDGFVFGKIINRPEIKEEFGTDTYLTEYYASSKYYNRIFSLMVIIYGAIVSLEILIIASILHIGFGDFKKIKDYIDHPTFSREYILFILSLLILLLIAFFITRGLNWIIKPFFMTIDEIKDWHKKN